MDVIHHILIPFENEDDAGKKRRLSAQTAYNAQKQKQYFVISSLINEENFDDWPSEKVWPIILGLLDCDNEQVNEDGVTISFADVSLSCDNSDFIQEERPHENDVVRVINALKILLRANNMDTRLKCVTLKGLIYNTISYTRFGVTRGGALGYVLFNKNVKVENFSPQKKRVPDVSQNKDPIPLMIVMEEKEE